MHVQGGTESFPVENSGRGYAVPSQLLMPCWRKCRAIPLLPLTVCTELQCLYKGYRFFPRGK